MYDGLAGSHFILNYLPVNSELHISTFWHHTNAIYFFYAVKSLNETKCLMLTSCGLLVNFINSVKNSLPNFILLVQYLLFSTNIIEYKPQVDNELQLWAALLTAHALKTFLMGDGAYLWNQYTYCVYFYSFLFGEKWSSLVLFTYISHIPVLNIQFWNLHTYNVYLYSFLFGEKWLSLVLFTNISQFPFLNIQFWNSYFEIQRHFVRLIISVFLDFKFTRLSFPNRM